MTASPLFLRIMAEKMQVIDEAWTAVGDGGGVAFLDADLVFTAPLLPMLRGLPGDLVLTPNYYPQGKDFLVARDGEFNTGFVFTRSRRFHHWWREAFDADPIKNNEQVCLNGAGEHFTVARLGEHANVGFWRSAQPPYYDEIPADCLFLHAHFYQPVANLRQWVDKSYAVHCLRFLMRSEGPGHQRLLERILAGDRHGWFEATLRMCGDLPPD